MTIILFIVVILVCVLVHEWGHYIVAKRSGMRVEEFGFGIPPRLFSWGKGETTYSINALPIGGFVKITGENGLEEGVPPERQFDAKPWYKKSAVLVAGVFMNFVLALVLFAGSYMAGLPAPTPDGVPTVVQVVADSPVARAGIVAGDTIIGIAIGGAQLKDLNTTTIREALHATDGPVVVSYARSGDVYTATILPIDQTIGVAIEPIGDVTGDLGASLRYAWVHTIAVTKEIIHVLGVLLQGIFSSGASAGIDLMGPVGLAREVGTAATFGFAYLMAFVAMISVNLAVLNILPFPALDGGRLIVVLLEALTKKKFSKKVVGLVHAVGFIILILLMIVLTIGDVKKVL